MRSNSYAKNKNFLLVLCFLALGIFLSNKLNKSTDAAVRFSKALKNQERLCGKSLDIAYTLDVIYPSDPSSPNKSQECRYIRTPKKLFLEIKDKQKVIRCSLDRKTNELRELVTRDNFAIAGFIDKYLGDLANRVFPDVVRFPLDATTLAELLDRGRVADKKQDIDGKPCWLVEVSSLYDKETCYLIYLDDSIGSCPRRIEIRRKYYKPQVIDFLKYKDLGNGVWQPMEIRNRYWDAPEPKGKIVEVVMRVKQVRINQPISDEELNLEFPLGTQVSDRIREINYEQF